MFSKFLLFAGIAAGISSAAVTCSSPNTSLGVLGQSAALQGCLSDIAVSGDGLTVFQGMNGFSGNTGASIAWSITSASNVYTYNYTFYAGGTRSFQPDLTYAVLGLGSNCNSATTNAVNNGSCIWDLKAPDNGGFDGSPTVINNLLIHGLEVIPENDKPYFSFSFKSALAPVWENAYFAGEGFTFGYNSGFGESGRSFYVASPNAQSVVPEPGQFAALAFGVGSLIYLVRRRRQA